MNDEFDEIVCTALERPIHSWGDIPFPYLYTLKYICRSCLKEQEEICQGRDSENISVQCKCGKTYTAIINA
jgi:hypothetical protein